MAKAYDYDLREKAVNAYHRGERKVDICKLLGISRNTLDLWLKREQETGDFKAVTGYQKGKPLKIKDMEQFKQFVLEHPDKTQQQLAELWGNGLTQQNVSDALKKLEITRKKNIWVSGTRRRETKGIYRPVRSRKTRKISLC